MRRRSGALRLSIAGLLAGLMLLAGGAARAHSPVFTVYSKYEATAYGRSVAFVFALDKTAVVQLVERDLHEKVGFAELETRRAFFADYLFARFTVSNAGQPCAHSGQLSRFGFDPSTQRVLAVTKFTCPSDLSDLAVRSQVTHDMPTSHTLVGDLQFGRVFDREFFVGDDVEARIPLATLAQGPPAPLRIMKRDKGRFLTVAVPDTKRRYTALAAAELGVKIVDADAPAATDGASFGAALLHFIRLGVFHIFTGYDHLLFIITLMLAVDAWRRLAIIVTSFTAAHSLTLACATLGWFRVPAGVTEPLIALSVLFVAAESIARPGRGARASLTFGFGLLHGLGLSSVLTDLGLAGRDLAPALLGFNLGVELGQLAVVAPLFPLVLHLRRRPELFARARRSVCVGVSGLAALWFFMRVKDALVG
jgi:hydrogenase/urease accessory protein HupE